MKKDIQKEIANYVAGKLPEPMAISLWCKLLQKRDLYDYFIIEFYLYHHN